MSGTEANAQGLELACLLVDAHARPDGEALVRLADGGAFDCPHGSAGEGGWIELLRDGLTFDLAGLAPGSASPTPAIANWYGVRPDEAGLTALTLSVGPHLAGAAHLLPVVRVAASLLAALAALPGVRGVAWLPAACATQRDWFVRAVAAWVDGGPFPALSLSALERDGQGALRSRGLSFLTGSEFRLTGCGGLAPDAAARIGLRLTDWIVSHGTIDTPREVVLDGVGALWLMPGEGLIEAHRR